MKKIITFTFAIALLSAAIINSCPSCNTLVGFGEITKETTIKTTEEAKSPFIMPKKTDRGRLRPPKDDRIPQYNKKKLGEKQPMEKPMMRQTGKAVEFLPAQQTPKKIQKAPKKTGWSLFK